MCAASAPVTKIETWSEANAAMLCAVATDGSWRNAIRWSSSSTCSLDASVTGRFAKTPGSV